jgi:indole-3-glycerol phosphate synthase
MDMPVKECKRMEPVSGSLRKRYDVSKLVKQLTEAGAPAISVNSDGVLFGGSMDDITRAREASDAAAVAESLNSSDGDGVVAPPVLASDLLLYPYQLYKLRLAGADAVTLLVGALEGKDLLYLTKIASTVQLQVVASVTSEVQISMVNKLGAGSVVALVVSNRDLETFGFDDSGEQALKLLRSEALASFREKNGDDVPILVEGRVGIVGAGDGDGVAYVRALKDAGAFGAIIGGGIAMVNEEDVAEYLVGCSL